MRHYKFSYLDLTLILFLLFIVIYGSIQRNKRAHFFVNESPFAINADNLLKDNGANAASKATFQIEKWVPTKEKSVHASALMDTGESLMVLFFAGSGEGKKDVNIYQSFFAKANLTNNHHGDWSEPASLLSRETLTKITGKYIKRIGNPIIFKDSHNKIHLFVVATSLGGWATAKIYQFYLSEDLKHLVYVNELHLGPFMNLSHLIRTPAIALENGGFMLPLYHELANKFSLVSFFDDSGKLIFSKEMADSDSLIQPSITAIDANSCLATFRVHQQRRDQQNNHTLSLQSCLQRGNLWQTPRLKSNLSNYDTSSVMLRFAQGFLLIHNDASMNPILNELSSCHLTFNAERQGSQDYLSKIKLAIKNACPKNNQSSKQTALQSQYGSRQSLSLFYLADTDLNSQRANFKRLGTIDLILPDGEVSYPAAIIDDTFLHISYTYARKNIKYIAIPTDKINLLIKKSRHLDNAFLNRNSDESTNNTVLFSEGIQ